VHQKKTTTKGQPIYFHHIRGNTSNFSSTAAHRTQKPGPILTVAPVLNIGTEETPPNDVIMDVHITAAASRSPASRRSSMRTLASQARRTASVRVIVKAVSKIERISMAAEALDKEAHCAPRGSIPLSLARSSQAWNEGEEVPFRSGARSDRMKGFWGKVLRHDGLSLKDTSGHTPNLPGADEWPITCPGRDAICSSRTHLICQPDSNSGR
jgi:hypothetical protein